MTNIPFSNLKDIFDFEKWKNLAIEIIWKIVSVPVKWWMNVPIYIKIIVYFVLILIGIYILYWAFKNKEEMYKVHA